MTPSCVDHGLGGRAGRGAALACILEFEGPKEFRMRLLMIQGGSRKSSGLRIQEGPQMFQARCRLAVDRDFTRDDASLDSTLQCRNRRKSAFFSLSRPGSTVEEDEPTLISVQPNPICAPLHNSRTGSAVPHDGPDSCFMLRIRTYGAQGAMRSGPSSLRLHRPPLRRPPLP